MFDTIKQIIAKHYYHPVFGCECVSENEDVTKRHLDESWEAHLAGLILEVV